MPLKKEKGGWRMTEQEYWRIFMATGSPEAYMLYCQAKRTEQTHVFDDESTGSTGNRLQ